MLECLRTIVMVTVKSIILAYITVGVAMVYGKAFRDRLLALRWCPAAICEY